MKRELILLSAEGIVAEEAEQIEEMFARGLRRCFGLKTGLISAFADNEVGRLLEDFILQGGVDMDYVQWLPYDGIGRKIRNGLNFTEKGFGVRGAVGCSDRGNSGLYPVVPL